jgi:hypothetical protein
MSSEEEEEEKEKEENQQVRRSKRSNKGKPPKWFEQFYLNHSSKTPEEPSTFQQVIKSSDKEKWLEAMDKEYAALLKSNTFTLVPLPNNRKAIEARWLFKVKRKADGTIDRYKARWVAKGYSQKFGIDYYDTYAPVVRLENLRFLIAYATQHELHIDQMDVDSAFLQAELQEDIYVEQPEGFISTKYPQYVCKLNKSLYGLKQAPLMWNNTLDKLIRQAGFTPIEPDPCIYVKKSTSDVTIVSVYVDDLLIIGQRKDIDIFKKFITEHFKTKDLATVKSILGIEVMRDQNKGVTYLLQRGYIEKNTRKI